MTTTDPPVPPTVPSIPEDEREVVLKRIQEILAEYKLKESDIPLTHEYWGLITRLRALNVTK